MQYSLTYYVILTQISTTRFNRLLIIDKFAIIHISIIHHHLYMKYAIFINYIVNRMLIGLKVETNDNKDRSIKFK